MGEKQHSHLPNLTLPPEYIWKKLHPKNEMLPNISVNFFIMVFPLLTAYVTVWSILSPMFAYLSPLLSELHTVNWRVSTPKKVRPVRIIIWCLRANAAWRHRKTWLTLSDRWGNHWSGWSSGHQTSPVVQTCWNLKPSCLTFPNKIAFATHWLQFLLPFRLLDLPVNTVSGPVPFGHRETLRCRHRCLNTLIDHLKTVGDLSRLGSGSCDFFFSLGWFGLWCLWENLW